MIPQIAFINYGALALTIAACVFLFITLKRDLRTMEIRDLRRTENLRCEVREVKEELEALRREIEIRESKADPSATLGRTLGSGVRIQALRMIKQGEGLDRIASELNLPRNEVELLMKVHKLMAGAVPQTTS